MRPVILSLLLLACSHPSPPAGVTPAPTASGEVVSGVWPLIDGEQLDLATLQGKIVIIHVTATWSPAADADLDELRAARAVDAAQVSLVSLGLDADGPRLLIPWRDAAQIDWPIAMPTPEIKAGTSPLGDVMGAVPETVVLDRDGRIVWRKDGGLPPGVLSAQVKKLLLQR